MKKFLIIIFILNISLILFSQSEIDSLEKIIETTKIDTVKIINYKKIISLYLHRNPKKALKYAKKMDRFTDSVGYEHYNAKAKYFLSIIYMQTGEYKKSIELSNKSIDIRKNIEKTKPKDSVNLSEISASYNILGVTYDMQGIYEKALEYYFLSMNIRDDLDEKKGQANCLTNIGLIYAKKEDFKKAIKYFKDALVIYKKINYQRGIALTYNNLGLIHKNSGDNQKALESYYKSLEIKQKMSDLRGIALTYNNIGQIYTDIEEYEKAIENYNQSIKISQQIGDQYNIAAVHNSLANHYKKIGNKDIALDYYLKAFNGFKKINSIEKIASTSFELSKLYADKNIYKKAYNYHLLYKKMSDSINSEKNTKKITRLQMQYEFDKKQKIAEIEQKKREQAAKAKLEKQKMMRNSFIIGFILMGLLAVVVFISYRLKRKDNKILAQQKIEILEKNEELEQQKEEILTQSEELEEINKELEKLSIVASKTDNAVMIIDADGNLEWVNEGFTRLFGYTYEQAIAKFGKKILLQSSNPEIKEKLSYCINNKKSVIYESFIKNKNNEEIWVQTTLTPILGINNKIEKIVAIDSDIRKLKEAENEIKQRNEEITLQKDQLQEQNEKIQIQNDLIKGSIRYAETIQQAILPSKSILDKYFENYIIYRPKDIVSGDFYWFSELILNDKKYLAVAVSDCTGHGVPGAFMSMIGSRLLSEIINEKKILNPAKVLKLLDENIIESLKQKESDNNDGMDISLLIFEQNSNNDYNMIFAGAKSKIFIYNNVKNDLEVLKGVRKTIGGTIGKHNKITFKNEYFKINVNDIIICVTDGIIDQNNYNRKRFGSKRLKRTIQENINYPLSEQKIKLEKALDNWQKQEQQRDDITVLGLKIKKSIFS